MTARGDNCTLLQMVQDLTGRPPAINLLAREVALLSAAACFRPVRAEHVPGVSNIVADVLSRRLQPDKRWVVPDCLRHVPEARLPARDRAWYRTLDPPLLRPADVRRIRDESRRNS